jgi:hypothetical protein
MGATRLIVFACASALAATPVLAGSAKGSDFSLSFGADANVEKGANFEKEAWRLRVERAKARYQIYADRAVKEYLTHSAALAGIAHVSIGAPTYTSIMKDPTLREGDIYVTKAGFMVFRGQPGFIHRASDFTQLQGARAKALSLVVGAQAD